MFSEFVKKAIKQDDRNVFELYKGKITGVPKKIESFYSKSNPVDVEVSIEGSYVKFIPYEDLESIQEEYSLGDDCFVFATCNGDPIYYKKKEVYSCVFGKKGIVEELLAKSLEEYLNKID